MMRPVLAGLATVLVIVAPRWAVVWVEAGAPAPHLRVAVVSATTDAPMIELRFDRLMR